MHVRHFLILLLITLLTGNVLGCGGGGGEDSATQQRLSDDEADDDGTNDDIVSDDDDDDTSTTTTSSTTTTTFTSTSTTTVAPTTTTTTTVGATTTTTLGSTTTTTTVVTTTTSTTTTTVPVEAVDWLVYDDLEGDFPTDNVEAYLEPTADRTSDNQFIWSPVDGRRYFSNEVRVSLTPEVIGWADTVHIDGQALPANLISQDIWLDDGVHSVTLLVDGDVVEEVSFSVFTDKNDTTTYTVNPRGGTIDLPTGFATGYTIEVISGEAIDFGFHSPNQPDFRWIDTIETWAQQIAAQYDDRVMLVRRFQWELNRWFANQCSGNWGMQWYKNHTLPLGLREGQGLCGENANIVGQLLAMAGVPESDIRSPGFNGHNGHIALEVKINGEWVFFDPQALAVYYENQQMWSTDDLLSNPDLVISHMDQMQAAATEVSLSYFHQVLEDTTEVDFDELAPPAWVPSLDLQEGDIFRVTPQGFAPKVRDEGCEEGIGHERQATATLQRHIDFDNWPHLSVAFPLNGLHIIVPTGQAGEVKWSMMLHNTEEIIEQSLWLTEGLNDLSHYLHELDGWVVETWFERDNGGNLDTATVVAFMAYPPRLVPDINPFQKTIKLESETDATVQVTVDTYWSRRQIEQLLFYPVSQANNWQAMRALEQSRDLLADQLDMSPLTISPAGELATFAVVPIAGPSQLASGRHYTVKADHDGIEVIASPRAGFRGLALGPMVHWLGPDPNISQPLLFYTHVKMGYNEAELPNEVTLTVYVDGQPTNHQQVLLLE